ncbi:MAG: shikimate kinase [Dethiobacteraceae bacterium]|jgi:shikimate kinase|nr:shikimate kinase [Bacillota bacterium]
MKSIAGKNLVLIGFMGTGKTEVGKLLASSLNRRLVDTDQLIVDRAGITIAEMFAQHGEPYFRRQEKAVIAELCQQKGLVISTGGGAILDPDNVAQLRAAGLVIWLDASVAELERRLADDQSRPLLAGGTKLAELYQQRENAYRQAAHRRVDTTGKSPLTVVGEIMDIIRQE